MSDATTGGGYHWRDSAHVKRWAERRHLIDQDRESGFRRMLEFLPADINAALKVIDIGAGDGKVASLVMDAYPNATAVLIDFSPEMMDKGAKDLARFAGRFRYLNWDMNFGDWPAELSGPFDAAVSSAAIHHLSNERKAWLAAEIAQRLAPGGAYANYDLFRNPTAEFGEDEVHDRTCATIAEATEALAEAGFQDISIGSRIPRRNGKCELALMVGLT